MPRSVISRWPTTGQLPQALQQFYREEFLKHERCLDHVRHYYSERAVSDVRAALTRILGELEQLCCKRDADRIISELLRKFDVVTGLSGWSDPREAH